MLKILRHKGVAKKILWVIAGIIIISFSGFGISRYSGGSLVGAAGKAFGKTVSIREFRTAYEDTRDQAFLMYGENASKILPLMDLDNETWTRILLLKEADRRGIKAGDGEVIAFIESIPFFQQDGAFSRRHYETMVANSFRRQPRDFEEGIRNQIRIMKMFRTETARINIPDDAVRKEYDRRNQKIQVSYVLFDPKKISDSMNMEDKDLETFYNAHKEAFMKPESIRLAYATFPLTKTTTPEEKKKFQTLAKTLAVNVRKGADLAAEAKTASAWFKTSGLFTMEEPDLSGNWSLELLQQAFESEPHAVLGPTETTDSIQVLQVMEKKAAVIPSFAEVKEKVKAKALADKAMAVARTNAADAVKTIALKVKAGTAFDAIAQELGLTKKTTPFFSLGEYIPEIGISEGIGEAAFALNKDNRLSGVVTTSRGPVVLYWEGLQPVDEKKFADEKQAFAKTLEEEQRTSLMNNLIKDIRDRAKPENYLEKVNKKTPKAVI